MTEAEFAQKVRELGGRAFIVGGWVRDRLRGVKPHDKDYMVSGLSEMDFCGMFPDAQKVGNSFPVYLLPIEGESSEVAFARKERKTGSGYTGFVTEYTPAVTVEEDLWRRDTTMNAIAAELTEDGQEKTLIDPFGGQEDIAQHRIRAVSAHFTEDPVRALRAARQSAAFGFTITEETYGYMHACREELADEPQERLLGELTRALRTPKPSVVFRAREKADVLDATFPELAALIGKTQPEAFHPEGDAWEHSMFVVDTVARDTDSLTARFAALAHDLGKGTTPESMLPHHYDHEVRGLDVLRTWNQRMTMPHQWVQAASFVIREHMRAPRLTKPGKITALLVAMQKQANVLPVSDFLAIIRADHHSLPYYLERAEEIIPLLRVSGREAPPWLRGPEVGQWIFSEQVKIFRDWKKENVC